MAEVLHGIDVSNHQNAAARAAGAAIDWPAVQRNGIGYGWCKATEGDGYQDPYLGANTAGLRSAGIPPGGYHFARAGDPAAQARYFATYAARFDLFGPGCLRPMLDVEDVAITDAWIAAWIAELRRITGVRRVIVYASRSFWQTRLHPERWADDGVLLWVADYNGDPGRLLWNHPALALHQHTETGRVAGFPAAVDKNVTVNGYGLADLLIEGDDMSWDDKMLPWGAAPGEEISARDMLRSAQGLAATLYAAFMPGGDPFGAPIFTDDPDTDHARTIRVRDLLGEMRANLQASAARETAAQALLVEIAKAGPAGFDLDAALQRVDETVRKALAEATVNVDVHVAGRPIDPTTGQEVSA